MLRAVNFLFASLIFTVLLAGSVSVAKADPVVITLTDPTRTLLAGSTGAFNGSLTNVSGAPVTVSGALLTFGIVGEAQGTVISLFFTDAFEDLVGPLGDGPLILAPGESTGVIPLFTFQLGNSIPGPSPVIVNGLFIVSQGDVFVPANELGRASWTITVLPNPNAVPEPATAVLLGIGLAGIAAKAYRKRRQFR